MNLTVCAGKKRKCECVSHYFITFFNFFYLFFFLVFVRTRVVEKDRQSRDMYKT